MVRYFEEEKRTAAPPLNILQAIFYILEAWRELPSSVIWNCWRHAGITPRAQEKDHFVSHKEHMEHMESRVRIAVESLLNINYSSEQLHVNFCFMQPEMFLIRRPII